LNCPNPDCLAKNGPIKMYRHGTVALKRRGKVARFRCPECGTTTTEKKEAKSLD
jgi:predicted RNA-binding Zn-ribbon protein involved in translation (DUF1610 family)